jgi:hypothetical protein
MNPNLKPFKKGVSGNPAGRPRKKPLTLSAAYQKQLATIDPATGTSYAEQIAELIIEAAVTGDTHAIMLALSNDAKGLVKSAVSKLVKASDCSPAQAKLALSLFVPEALI